MIYFIRCPERQAIKIGVAVDVSRRLKELQAGCPDELVIYGVCHGDWTVEQNLLARFQSCRIRGEWLRENAQLLADIDGLIVNDPPREAYRFGFNQRTRFIP